MQRYVFYNTPFRMLSWEFYMLLGIVVVIAALVIERPKGFQVGAAGLIILGVLLGFQAALSLQKKPTGDPSLDPYSLALSVAKSGDSLNIRWDRLAPAIRGAQRGVLQITDGAYHKQLDLDPSQLQIGSVIYRRVSGSVSFRLEVFTRDRTSLVETWEYKDTIATPENK